MLKSYEKRINTLQVLHQGTLPTNNACHARPLLKSTDKHSNCPKEARHCWLNSAKAETMKCHQKNAGASLFQCKMRAPYPCIIPLKLSVKQTEQILYDGLYEYLADKVWHSDKADRAPQRIVNICTVTFQLSCKTSISHHTSSSLFQKL